jgi:hypothetical protein
MDTVLIILKIYQLAKDGPITRYSVTILCRSCSYFSYCMLGQTCFRAIEPVIAYQWLQEEDAVSRRV